MNWETITTKARILVGEDNNSFFKDQDIKLLGGSVQSTIAETAKCLVDTYSFNTTTDIQYSLPVDCISVYDVKAADKPLAQLGKRPNIYDYPSGTITTFFVEGNEIGFYPKPSSATAIVVRYFKTTPEFGIMCWHDGGESGTNCTVQVYSDKVRFSITGGTYDGTDVDFEFATYTTISALVTAINAHGTADSGLRAILNDTVLSTRASTDLAATYQNETCYGFSAKKFLFLNPELPNEAQDLLIDGIVEQLKYRDHEMGASDREKSIFYNKLDAFRRRWFRRNFSAYYQNATGSNFKARCRDETITVIDG